jgi:hypothetical protein
MRKKRLILLTFVAVILLLLTACFMQSEEIPQADPVPIRDVVVHETFSQDVHRNDPPWAKARGIAVGFVRPEDRGKPVAQRPQIDEFVLSPGQPFAPYLIVQMKEETTALVSVLLDLQQVAFELDGQKGLLHEITLEPGVGYEIPIQVDVTEPGIHELAVVVFADPYNSSLDPEYRMSGVSRKTGGKRANVIVGDDRDRIAGQMPQVLSGVTVPEDVDLGFHAAFASAPDGAGTHPSQRQLYVAEGKAGETFDYQLWASNLLGEEGEESDYALMVFQDYHQVPVQGRDVTVAHLDPAEEVILDAEVQLPQTPGVSQMQIIYFFDPYKSILHDEVRASFVFSSFRIGVHVTK